jgi:hypothetical protein
MPKIFLTTKSSKMFKLQKLRHRCRKYFWRPSHRKFQSCKSYDIDTENIFDDQVIENFKVAKVTTTMPKIFLTTKSSKISKLQKLRHRYRKYFWLPSHRKFQSCKSYDIDTENIFDDQVSKLQKLSSHRKFQSYQVIENFKVAKVIKSSKCNWDARGRMVTGVTKFKGNVTEMRAVAW